MQISIYQLHTPFLSLKLDNLMYHVLPDTAINAEGLIKCVIFNGDLH